MSSFVIVELHTVETERLKGFPGRERVLKARYQTIGSDGEISNITPQKLRPFQALWTEELKQLKLNERILEKYQSLEEFLSAVGGDSILIPGSPESVEILLDVQHQQQTTPTVPGMRVFCLTPGIVSGITGRMFQAGTSVPIMQRVLRESQEMFEQLDVDLLEPEGAFIEKFFGDCDQRPTSSISPNEPRFSLMERQAGVVESDFYKLEQVVELFQQLQKGFPDRLRDVIWRLTGRFDSRDFPSLAGQQAHEALKIEAEQMLNNRHLEQMGLKSTDFFDVRHAAPGQTFVKFYTKVSVGDKLQTAVDFYQQRQAFHGRGGPVRLVGKPCIVEYFPPNPTFLLVRGVPSDVPPGPYCQQLLQQIYKAFPQNYKKAADQCFCFRQQSYAQEVRPGVDRLSLAQITSQVDLALLFPQADHENNRRIHAVLQDLLQGEWGVVSELQIQQTQRTRPWFRVELPDQQPQNLPGYNPGYHPEPRSLVQQPQNLPSQPYQTPVFSSKIQDISELKPLPVGSRVTPTNAKLLRAQAIGLQLHLLPGDAKIKDVAGFCKQQRVAEHMAWFLHQPFTAALGPIRLSPQYALLIFLSREHAAQAEQILQTALFKGQRVKVLPAVEADTAYIDACFTPKDPPFLPCFAVILKQIKLPQDYRELVEVVHEHWKQQKPETARVQQDSGILYYRNPQDAERTFQGLRQLLFQQHQNDIFRMDYD